MASKRQIQFLSSKIESLEQEKQNLHRVLDEYIDKVVVEGKLWIDNQGLTSQSYENVCMSIFRTTTFLLAKCDEIEGESDRNKNEGCNDGENTSQSALSTLSTSSSSAYATRSVSAGSVSVSADDLLSKLQERVEIIESKMTNMSGKVDEILEIRTGMEEMKTKMKKSEEMNEKTLTKLEEEVDTSAEEYSANRSMDGKRLQELEDKIGGLSQDMNSLGDDVRGVTEKVDQTDKRLSKVEKRIENAEDRIYDVEMEQEEGGAKLMKKRMETLERKQENLESLEEIVRRIDSERKGKDNERMNKVEEMLSKIEEEKLPTLENRLLKVEEDGRKDHAEIENVKSEVSSLSSQVKVVEGKQEEGEGKTQDLRPGFVAEIPDGSTPSLTEGTVVNVFRDVKLNRGDAFNPWTGVFTAPVDGLYLANLCVTKHNDGGHIGLGVYHEPVTQWHGMAGFVNKVQVCGESVTSSGTFTKSIHVAMKKGDRLYVWVSRADRGDSRYICCRKIGWPSTFSCELVS